MKACGDLEIFLSFSNRDTCEPRGTVEESNSSSTSSLLFERWNLLSPQQCLCVGFTLSFFCDNLLSFLRVSVSIAQYLQQETFVSDFFHYWL